MNELIRIHESDSVAVALRPLNAGESVNVTGTGFRINVSKNIPMGHKILRHEINAGDKIIFRYTEMAIFKTGATLRE